MGAFDRVSKSTTHRLRVRRATQCATPPRIELYHFTHVYSPMIHISVSVNYYFKAECLGQVVYTHP